MIFEAYQKVAWSQCAGIEKMWSTKRDGNELDHVFLEDTKVTFLVPLSEVHSL